MQIQTNVVKKPTRSWHAWISSIGLAYVVLLTLRVELVRALSRGGPDLESLVFYGPFTALSLVATVFILRGKRWSYRLGLIVSAVFLFFQILFFLFSGGGLGNLRNPGFFLTAIVPIPVLILVVYHTALGRRELRRGTEKATSVRGPTVVIPSILVGAFIVGGVLFGLLGPTTPSPQGIVRDVTIVDGAFYPASLQAYVPAKLTIKVGDTVVWYNEDSAHHTISSVDGAFDSGDVSIGAFYRYTFTQPGTYEYVCDYHPFMRGIIVVTAS